MPDITACPLCKRPSLTVYNDPLSGNSRWLRCKSCRFSGDTIETYQRISRSPTVLAAIQEARNNGLCDAPIDRITPSHIQGYMETCLGHRAKVMDIWNRVKLEALDDPTPELIRHVQSKQLWYGWRRGPHTQMSQFMGGAMRYTVDSLFMRHFNRRILPRRGYGVVMVVPYQDVPGRICGMRFIGLDEEFDVPLVPVKMDNPEGGLALLDVLDGMEKTVFAVSRLDFALQLHKYNLINRITPLKLVSYTDTTTLQAWNSVMAERIIFWSDEIDWRLFRQAKQLKNAWIANHPQLLAAKRDVSIYLSDHAPEIVIRSLESHALPWPQFVANWVLDKKRTQEEIQATLSSASFNPSDIAAVIGACPSHELGRLQRLLEPATVTGPEILIVHGRPVIERVGGWYHITRHGESLITDAKVKLESESTESGMGEVCWNGAIHYSGQVIPFLGEPYRKIDKDPEKWLQEKTAQAGLGYPKFDRYWASQFINVVKELNKNHRKTQTTDRLGMNDDMIRFPQFAICGGEFVKADYPVSTSDSPAYDVKRPEIRAEPVAEPATAARAAWFAAVAAFVAKLTGKLKCPVYVVDSSSVSSISAFMAAAGMRAFHADLGDDAEKNKLLYLTRRFNYPVHLQTPGDVLYKLPAESYAHCFVPVQRLSALSLCTRDEGVILRDARPDENDNLPPFDDVLWYLADLQRRKFDLGSGNPVLGALRGYCQFLEGYLSGFDRTHGGLATNRIRMSDQQGTVFLELVALLCLSGKLGHVQQELGLALAGGYIPNQARKAICSDPENGRVYLPHRAIQRACDRAGIPRPDLFKVEKDLVARKSLLSSAIPDGLLVPFDLWNGVIKGCRGELNSSV